MSIPISSESSRDKIKGLSSSGLSYVSETSILPYTTSWIEISKQAVLHNIQHYRSIIGPKIFLAPVIKANAYGHGIIPMAKLCEENPEVNYICVVRLTEAIALRQQGIKKPILVLSIIDEDPIQTIVYDIDVVVYDTAMVQQLNARSATLQKKINIHIKIDTGLSRLGIVWQKAIDIIKNWQQFYWIEFKGIFTHFAESESDNQEFTLLQQQRFDYVIKTLKQENIVFSFIHASCSAAVIASSAYHYNFVRLGIGLYGLWPSLENKGIALKAHPTFSLQPILSWKTKIIQIKTLPAQSWVGYDRTFYTDREITIAVLPIGYSDGYDRGLSNKGMVLINNQYAPILGRIAMNLMMIDITGITQVDLDSIVTLLGDQEQVSADYLAKQCSTINYEITSRINAAISRIIVDRS